MLTLRSGACKLRARLHARSVSIHVARILVAIDHSTGTDAVVEYACAIARGVGASITVLHVYEPPNEMVGIVPGSTVAGEVKAEHDAGMALLEHAADVARANGIAYVDRTLERSPSPHAAIVTHARSGKFDLIVMGTHARKKFASLVMGSVARQVVHDAPCAVLLVHLQPATA